MNKISHPLLIGSPLSRQSLSYPSAFLFLASVLKYSFSPPTSMLINLSVYSVMTTLLERYTWKEKKKPLSIWLASHLVYCKSWGTHVLFLSRTPSIPSFPNYTLSLSVYWFHEWHVSPCICSHITDLATWAKRQGTCLEPPKHRYLVPGLLFLS